MSALEPEVHELLSSFRLRKSQKARVWDAYLADPDGLVRIAHRARNVGTRNGNTGAGLLLSMIHEEEHLLNPDESRPARRITGWRFVRGSHGATYVRDKLGTDPLPEGYGLDG